MSPTIQSWTAVRSFIVLAGLLGTFRSGAAPLLAHQGGWDEILLIVGPMAAIAGLLVVAKRRVDAAARPRSDD